MGDSSLVREDLKKLQAFNELRNSEFLLFSRLEFSS